MNYKKLDKDTYYISDYEDKFQETEEYLENYERIYECCMKIAGILKNASKYSFYNSYSDDRRAIVNY